MKVETRNKGRWGRLYKKSKKKKRKTRQEHVKQRDRRGMRKSRRRTRWRRRNGLCQTNTSKRRMMENINGDQNPNKHKSLLLLPPLQQKKNLMKLQMYQINRLKMGKKNYCHVSFIKKISEINKHGWQGGDKKKKKCWYSGEAEDPYKLLVLKIRQSDRNDDPPNKGYGSVYSDGKMLISDLSSRPHLRSPNVWVRSQDKRPPSLPPTCTTIRRDVDKWKYYRIGNLKICRRPPPRPEVKRLEYEWEDRGNFSEKRLRHKQNSGKGVKRRHLLLRINKQCQYRKATGKVRDSRQRLIGTLPNGAPVIVHFEDSLSPRKVSLKSSF